MKNKTVNKVIGYVRVSTEDQVDKGYSIEHQEEKIKLYCQLNDLELDEIIYDRGVSAKTTNRPGMNRLMAKVRKGFINGVVIFMLDRMFRVTKDALIIKEEFDKHKVILHSVVEKIDTSSPMGIFVFQTINNINELERNTVSFRTTGVIQSKKKKGLVYNHAPFGFDNGNNGRLKLNVEEMKVVQEIFASLKEGQTYRCIADLLNHREIPTKKKKKWHASTVQNIEKNLEDLYEPFLSIDI